MKIHETKKWGDPTHEVEAEGKKCKRRETFINQTHVFEGILYDSPPIQKQNKCAISVSQLYILITLQV